MSSLPSSKPLCRVPVAYVFRSSNCCACLWAGRTTKMAIVFGMDPVHWIDLGCGASYQSKIQFLRLDSRLFPAFRGHQVTRDFQPVFLLVFKEAVFSSLPQAGCLRVLRWWPFPFDATSGLLIAACWGASRVGVQAGAKRSGHYRVGFPRLARSPQTNAIAGLFQRDISAI